MVVSDCKDIYFLNQSMIKVYNAGRVLWEKVKEDPCQVNCQTACESRCQATCQRSRQCGSCQRYTQCGRCESGQCGSCEAKCQIGECGGGQACAIRLGECKKSCQEIESGAS